MFGSVRFAGRAELGFSGSPRTWLEPNSLITDLQYPLGPCGVACDSSRFRMAWATSRRVTYGALMTMTSAGAYGSSVAFAVGALGGIAAGLGFGLVLGSMHARNNASTGRSRFHLVT